MVRDNSEAKEVAEDHSKAELRVLVRDFSKAEEVENDHSTAKS